MPPTLESLRAKYSGTITSGTNEERAQDYISRMNDLLQEWDPSGASASDVISLIGEPSERSDSALIYVFDFGYGGVKFAFQLQDGRVTVVETDGLE